MPLTSLAGSGESADLAAWRAELGVVPALPLKNNETYTPVLRVPTTGPPFLVTWTHAATQDDADATISSLVTYTKGEGNWRVFPTTVTLYEGSTAVVWSAGVGSPPYIVIVGGSADGVRFGKKTTWQMDPLCGIVVRTVALVLYTSGITPVPVLLSHPLMHGGSLCVAVALADRVAASASSRTALWGSPPTPPWCTTTSCTSLADTREWPCITRCMAAGCVSRSGYCSRHS
jgi:hypothetical protein